MNLAELAKLWATTLEEEIESIETDLDPKEWTRSGRPFMGRRGPCKECGQESHPRGEDWSWWIDHGVLMLDKYQQWRDGDDINEPWELWVTPDGEPAIELQFEVPWGDTKLRGIIDRVFLHPFDGELAVVDIKSGSWPSNMRQLGRYASALELKYGTRPRYGGFYMARSANCVLHRLDRPSLSIEHLTGITEKIAQAYELGLFIANPGALCRSCGVRQFCKERE